MESLYSDRAKAVLDNYFPFPEPKAPVRYNFDQGVPARELYPLADINEYVQRAVVSDGTLTCGYFGPTGFEEMTYGYAGLRQTIAERIELNAYPEYAAVKRRLFTKDPPAGTTALVSGSLVPGALPEVEAVAVD